MGDKRYMLFTILIFAITLSGCSTKSPNESSSTAVAAHGHVFLDGKAISGAAIEAVSANGTDHRSAASGDDGTYVLSVTPDTRYNVTATYRGLRHTIWPVCLPGDMDTFDINLTTTPTSTIEGSGYTVISVAPWESKEGRYKTYNHTRWSGFLIEARSMNDNATVTATTDNNGSYVLGIEPDMEYDLSGYFYAPGGYPLAGFNYRNDGGLSSGYSLVVGPNETALVDYVFPMP